MKKPNKQYEREQSPLSNIQSKRKLAEILKIDFETCKNLISASDTFYYVWPNKDGRVIEEPVNAMRLVHETIAKYLKKIQVPDFLFCPVKGRSALANARKHIGNDELIKLDIAKYFPSTRFERIFDFFHSGMKCSRDVAWSLAKICSYKEHLPTGSPLSPYISYFAHEKMWLKIRELCSEDNYTMTVYVDDLAISGKKLKGTTIWLIKNEIKKYGLKYHKEKKYNKSHPKLVTGAIIKDEQLRLRNRHHQKIRLLKKEMKNTKTSAEKQKLENSVKGLVNYAKQMDS